MRATSPAKTFEELTEDFKRIKGEMDLARLHQHRYARRERELYKDYCIALSRLLDHPNLNLPEAQS